MLILSILIIIIQNDNANTRNNALNDKHNICNEKKMIILIAKPREQHVATPESFNANCLWP